MIDAAVMSSARTKGGTGTDVWGTPPSVLERVRRVGPIGLDPCCDEDNTTSLLAMYTEEDDGLTKDWHSTLLVVGAAKPFGTYLGFVNFPYSKAAAWATKCAEEASKGASLIVLSAARPDTRWWKTLWDASDAVAFWRGRLRFVGAPASAPFPSALFGLNVSSRRFRNAFSDAAEVVRPW